MGKTLHIIPSGIIWPLIVEKWFGDEPDKANHEVIQYPVPTNLHYQPDALTDVEMMKTAISWYKPNSYPVADLYQDLMKFVEAVKEGPEYDRVIVWHAEDADSRLLLYLFAYTYKHRFYAIDVTPEEHRYNWKPYDEDYEQLEEVKVYIDCDVDRDSVSRKSFRPRMVTQKMRKQYYEAWKSWAGEDALGSPVLVSQFGTFFHPYRTYLYSDVFDTTPKDQPKTIGDICKEIYAKHPQIGQDVIYDAVTRMADAGMIKWVKKVESNPLHHQLQQYKYDVEGEWKEYPRDYLHQFAHECGKKITLSEDELKAEFFRDHKDYEDLFCQGHLARADRAKLRQQWDDRLLVTWASAFNENWGWYHLMSVMQVKLEMMVEYMRHWSHIANGPVYADQMERAIRLMKVILDWGGESEYKHTEAENDYFDAKHFSRYVNFKNRKRFPSPDYDGHHFWCKAQRLRFDKAWNLLWEMFRSKLLTWDD